jgi:hypothetical protein
VHLHNMLTSLHVFWEQQRRTQRPGVLSSMRFERLSQATATWFERLCHSGMTASCAARPQHCTANLCMLGPHQLCMTHLTVCAASDLIGGMTEPKSMMNMGACTCACACLD